MEPFGTTGISKDITTSILLHSSLMDIINLLRVNKSIRLLIYNLLPGIMMNNYQKNRELGKFYLELLKMNEKALLKKAINQVYQITQDANAYLKLLLIVMRENIDFLTVFFDILPMFDIPGFMEQTSSYIELYNSTIQTKFLTGLLQYSIRNNLINYIKKGLDFYNKYMLDGSTDRELDELIKEAKIVLEIQK